MKKKKYIAPQIELIELDNDISLILESTPPSGPGEEVLLAPEYQNINPLKSTMG